MRGLVGAVLTVHVHQRMLVGNHSCAHTAWVSEGERVARSEYVPARCLSDLVNNGQRAQEPGTHAHAGVSVSTVYIHTYIAAGEPGPSRVPHVRGMHPEVLEAAIETHAGPQTTPEVTTGTVPPTTDNIRHSTTHGMAMSMSCGGSSHRRCRTVQRTPV